MYLCHLIRNRVKISTVKPLLQSVRTESPLLEVKDSQDKAFIDIKLRPCRNATSGSRSAHYGLA